MSFTSADALERALSLSSFASLTAERHADWLNANMEALLYPPNFAQWRESVNKESDAATDIESLKRVLRVGRARLQLHMVVRHAAGLADCDETVSSASYAADLFIDAAVRWVENTLDQEGRFGAPIGAASGERQRLVVLALGKLGAFELNLSSDVDLILAYPEAGTTERGKTNQQYFVRAAQMLVDALDPVTIDGFVFRVDLRLRPYGDSGPLVMHFDAMEAYFETQGRDWERYAFIKARVCAGDIEAGREMLQRLRPFTFRRYLDFGAIQSLRDMKTRIVKENRSADDVKLGSGGIRDIEFGVQVLQLIWGGREAELQTPNLLLVLPVLASLGHIDVDVAEALADAYRFLRDTEHSIQALNDEQTQLLPSQEDQRFAVAQMMGFASFDEFLLALAPKRALAQQFFEDSVAPVEPQDAGLNWDEQTAGSLEELGLDGGEQCVEYLQSLATARDRASVSVDGRERLDALMPHVLQDLSERTDAPMVLARLVPILRAVLRRSAYLVLLQENPQAREVLLELLSRSQWLADRVCEKPMHLDALLSDRLDALPDQQSLREELRLRIESVRNDGEERVLDVLREYRQQHAFTVAVAELSGRLPLMKASDYYSYLAEALLEEALDVAWRACDGPSERPFIIVGYGKLGGIELGPSSDLDLVFIHNFQTDQSRFLHRLARKLLHVLTARTYNGVLYEIDMRLRPSGSAGTMISRLDAYVAYQRKQAWTWEQQALVRARPVAGDAELAGAFDAARKELICQPRDHEQLRQAVVEMRSRLSAHHGDQQDLKQGSGGIVDIEFMVQYLALAHAHAHPQLAQYSDNVRILQAAGASGVLQEHVTQALHQAYVALRAEAHRHALDIPNPERAERVLEQHREVVRGAWNDLFGDIEA